VGGGVVRASACGVGVRARLRLGLVGGGVVGASACDSVVGARLGVVGASACGGVVGGGGDGECRPEGASEVGALVVVVVVSAGRRGRAR
jgi:hypothetical protein